VLGILFPFLFKYRHEREAAMAAARH